MATNDEERSTSADPKGELTRQSEEILRAIEDLRRMERDKRTREISTPEFTRLAEEITQKSREIFRIASRQERLGDELPQQSESIDDAAEREPPASEDGQPRD